MKKVSVNPTQRELRVESGLGKISLPDTMQDSNPKLEYMPIKSSFLQFLYFTGQLLVHSFYYKYQEKLPLLNTDIQKREIFLFWLFVFEYKCENWTVLVRCSLSLNYLFLNISFQKQIIQP